MLDNKKLAEILLPYGTVETGHSQAGEWPLRRTGHWQIPLDGQSVLLVPEVNLPPAVGALLDLMLEDRGGERGVIERWLSGADEPDPAVLANALETSGWQTAAGACVITVERDSASGEPADLADAVEMLRELVSVEPCAIATDGKKRIYLLLPAQETNETPGSGRPRVLAKETLEPSNTQEMMEGLFFSEELSGWLDTLGAELFSLFRAGFSAPVETWSKLPDARREAQFALDAGRLYRSKERVHDFRKLGLSRLFHGLPSDIQAQFLQEVLPEDVFAGLSSELRETVFAFLEHGQQVADTARSLYIHRNTLLYRLDRIAELTGYDVRQPLQAWTLWMALTLRRAS
ncbi:PucR family transcriptional regulator [Tumebacillus flagellatus]|uniref:PucR C-terminal helix-turn-helix domain-containing protein n=1 Tax=Tumebacillus flagellatus TaxID=1157490 RepID=A0A074LVB3_9BACL|nr:helix-turn-helix domain-containing protein [Tumebacillus flagellatus]KEO84590.1 hypothetical protein EL26_03475 [Tumebacillus flagellatus]